MRTSHLCIGLFLVTGCTASMSAQAHQQAIAREAVACADVSPAQAHGPFAQRGEILSVEPLIRSTTDTREPHVVGARAIFRETTGATAALFRREVACELARDESLGHPIRGTEQFPEAVAGTQVQVSPVSTGIEVDVAATDDAGAQEVLRRALALAPRPR